MVALLEGIRRIKIHSQYHSIPSELYAHSVERTHVHVYSMLQWGERWRERVPEEINKCEVTECYSSFYHLPPPLPFSLSLLSALSIASMQRSCSYRSLSAIDEWAHTHAHTSRAHRLFVSLAFWLMSTHTRHAYARHLRQHMYTVAHVVYARTHTQLCATCRCD